ncbi:acyl-CoA thioesterase [Lacimicrobium alkaliphilum]|uniref:Thioesterase n=1 Tax=Lacimicrobium alkaliphilum TaxID=1526571 RepID=A0ABQ1R7U8_9ALTE|nr:thioesterase family protein [Lacimicrobium alkaliphilum]GGD61551.1 thioesterase [Lacimicrobium alkaliphilum]
MLSETFKVRFYETDALKHVSNTVLAGWFEAARDPVFRIFTPDADLDNWPLILASYKIDFLRQIYFGHEVEIRTGIQRVGNSSFEVIQQVWQQGEKAAEGITTLVHFDYHQQKSAPIPEDVSKQLQTLLISEE